MFCTLLSVLLSISIVINVHSLLYFQSFTRHACLWYVTFVADTSLFVVDTSASSLIRQWSSMHAMHVVCFIRHWSTCFRIGIPVLHKATLRHCILYNPEQNSLTSSLIRISWSFNNHFMYFLVIFFIRDKRIWSSIIKSNNHIMFKTQKLSQTGDNWAGWGFQKNCKRLCLRGWVSTTYPQPGQ